MQKTDVIVVGGGQSGLVMSRSLAARGIDHVVLERGRIGERWHSERWHSLHQTP
jgi:putative flavoprotein involved in K+ transport